MRIVKTGVQRMSGVDSRPAWQALVTHHAHTGRMHLRQLFPDAHRGTARLTPYTLGSQAPELAHDSSTNTLIRRYRRLREARP